MIVLDTTTRALEVVLAGAATTSQLPVVGSFVDFTSGFTPATAYTQTNGTTAVTAIAAPAADCQRQVKLLAILNADTAPATVTVRLTDSSGPATRPIFRATLAVGDNLLYTDGEGFRVLDADGQLKQAGNGAGGPASGDLAGSYPSPTVARASNEFALTGDLTPAALGSDQDNWNPTGLAAAAVVRVAASTTINITGLAGGADGRVLLLHNVGASAVTFKDQSASSTASNRFALNGDLALAEDEAAVLWYDSTTSRWRCAGSYRATGGSASAATQAEMEAASSTTTYASPGRTQYHPGVAKAWCEFNPITPATLASHNIASVTDSGVGDAIFNFSAAFSSANYVVVALHEATAAAPDDGRQAGVVLRTGGRATGSCRLRGYNQVSGANSDPATYNVAFLGDQ